MQRSAVVLSVLILLAGCCRSLPSDSQAREAVAIPFCAHPDGKLISLGKLNAEVRVREDPHICEYHFLMAVELPDSLA
jgi:hypothetical protein